MKEVKVCGQCAELLQHGEERIRIGLPWGCPVEQCDLELCGTCSNSEVHLDEKGRCAKWWGTNLTKKEINERMQEAALENAIRKFADALEEAGYRDALELIRNTLLSLARQKGISLLDAAWEYSNQEEEQDTSWFQLFHALQKIPNAVIQKIDINCPLE